MKKFFYGMIAVLSVSLFLIGCGDAEGGAAGAAGVAGRLGDGHIGGSASAAGLQAMIDRYDGTGAELVLDNVELSDDGNVDFKSVRVHVVGTFATASDSTTLINAARATVTFADGAEISLTESDNILVGAASLAENVTGDGSLVPVVTAAELANATGDVAVASFSLDDAAKIPVGVTGLYVYDTLTVTAVSTAPTSVVALGTVSVSGTNAVALATGVDLSNATLTNSAVADVTLPTTAVVKAIAVGSEGLTITGAGTSFTVGSITNGGGDLKLAAAATITQAAGAVTTGTFKFGTAAQVLAKPTLANSKLTLGGNTTLLGTLDLGNTAKLELSGATLTTAAAAVTLGATGGTFTPAGAGVTFPADTVLDGASKTVTLGSAGLTLDGASFTSLAVGASGVLKGKVVLDDGTNKVTLTGATITAADAAVTLTKANAVVAMAAGTKIALANGGSIAFEGAGVVNTFTATPIVLSGGTFTNSGDTLTLAATSAATATLTGTTLTKLTLGTGAKIAIPADATTGFVLTGVIVDLSTAGSITIVNLGVLKLGVETTAGANYVAGIITKYNGTGTVVVAGGNTSGAITDAANVTAFNSKADYAAIVTAISTGVGVQGVFTAGASKNNTIDQNDTFALDTASPALAVTNVAD